MKICPKCWKWFHAINIKNMNKKQQWNCANHRVRWYSGNLLRCNNAIWHQQTKPTYVECTLTNWFERHLYPYKLFLGLNVLNKQLTFPGLIAKLWLIVWSAWRPIYSIDEFLLDRLKTMYQIIHSKHNFLSCVASWLWWMNAQIFIFHVNNWWTLNWTLNCAYTNIIWIQWCYLNGHWNLMNMIDIIFSLVLTGKNWLGHHWFSWWLEIYLCQAITWTNAEWMSVGPSTTKYSGIKWRNIVILIWEKISCKCYLHNGAHMVQGPAY